MSQKFRTKYHNKIVSGILALFKKHEYLQQFTASITNKIQIIDFQIEYWFLLFLDFKEHMGKSIFVIRVYRKDFLASFTQI